MLAHDSGHSPSQASDSQTYEIGPLEGPGDPDGDGPAPYTFQAIIFTFCETAQTPYGECTQNGGQVWNACDSNAHEANGGNPLNDLTCSSSELFDHAFVDIQYATEPVLPRNIPAAVTTCSNDGDTLCGEGNGNDAANDGEGTFDEAPGPREVEVGICSEGDITRPSTNDAWGTEDGIISQPGQYQTHHLGSDSTAVDPGDEYRAHPGVNNFSVFIQGAFHGTVSCADASPINTLTGDIEVTLS